MTPYLFVYGTLKRGQAAAHLLSSGTYVGEAKVQASLVHLGIYLALTPGGESVDGELFKVPEGIFSVLDEYEGSGYERRLTAVEMGGVGVVAWAYWLV